MRQQRQGQQAVRDRPAERTVRRALGVDVDPLMIVGGVGEQVDTVLVDLEPFGGAQFCALCCDELVQPVELLHHFSSPRCALEHNRLVAVSNDAILTVP